VERIPSSESVGCPVHQEILRLLGISNVIIISTTALHRTLSWPRTREIQSKSRMSVSNTNLRVSLPGG